MPFSINPDLIENNDVEIQTVDGELALFHKPSGNTLIVDEDTSVSEKLQSPLRGDVDFDGNDLNSGGNASFEALEAEQIPSNVDDGVTKSTIPFWFPIIDDFNRPVSDVYSGDVNEVIAEAGKFLTAGQSIRTAEENSTTTLEGSMHIYRGFRYRMYIYFDEHDSQGRQLIDFRMSTVPDEDVSDGDGYRVWSRVDGSDNIKIQRYDDGSGSSLATSEFTIPTDEWLVLEIDMEFISVSATLKELDGGVIGSSEADDDTYTSGYFGFGLRSDEVSNENYSYVDHISRRPL